MVEKGLLSVEFIYCGCNCGKTLAKYDKGGRERRYIIGHNNIGKKLGVRNPNRFCMIDPTHKTYINPKGWEDWTRCKDGYICRSCNFRLNITPIFTTRRLRFKYNRILLKYTVRTGYCSLCTNKIHNGSCKRTNIHHLIYITILPWFGTIELCHSCHRKEHHKLNKKE